MRFLLLIAALACLSLTEVAFAGDYKVEPVKEAPMGLSAEITERLATEGFRISGKDGVICDLWVVKKAGLKPTFKPSLRIKYPFDRGELVGVIRFPEKDSNDFRGQTIAPGVYTLRYGQQPDDGNHLGTSDIRDFLLACPPKVDKTAARIEMPKSLFRLSAEAAGTAHPAIFLLLPPAEAAKEPVIHEDEEKKHVSVQLNVGGSDGKSEVTVPVTIVVVGKAEG